MSPTDGHHQPNGHSRHINTSILDPDLLVAFVGPRACGKSVILKLLVMLYGDEFLALESSGLCDDHIARDTAVGRELVEYKSVRTNGNFYPDDLIVKTTLQSIEEKKAETLAKKQGGQIRGIGLAGGFRTEAQRLRFGGTGYRTRAVHMRSTLRQVFEGVVRRSQIEGQKRDDISIPSVINSWHNYRNLVCPGMDSVPKDQICIIDKRDPLLHKMSIIIRHIDSWMGTDGLIRFAAKDHPVRREIHRLNQEWSRTSVILTGEMEDAIAEVLAEEAEHGEQQAMLQLESGRARSLAPA